MAEGSGVNEGSALLVALKEARADPDNGLSRTIAILWSWLDRNLLTLGSLHEKPPMVRSAAIDAERFPGVLNDKLLKWVGEEPLRNAAEMLARIELHFYKTPLVASRVPDIEGNDVLVSWREPALIMIASDWLAYEKERNARESDGDVDPRDLPSPPTSNEHPSLSTLAPRLNVSPVRERGIDLRVPSTDDAHFAAVRTKLKKALAGPDVDFSVHLDTLGPHGLSGLDRAPDGPIECRTACFDPSSITKKDEEACIAAARKAVRRARGYGHVLVLPELCATPKVVDAIRHELGVMHGEERAARRKEARKGTADEDKSKVKGPPALTIVGLYHLPPEQSPALDPSLVKNAPAAEFVNEALAMGPTGKVLWRHRKLSSAQGKTDEEAVKKYDLAKSYIEDIVLGTTLTLVPTPLGLVSVVICLDAFAPHVRDRLAKSPTEILFVPSLSPEAKRHRTSLGHLVQSLWGAAFVCNRSYAASNGSSVWDESENRSFWVLQRNAVVIPRRKRSKTAHPSFVFRLAREVAASKTKPDGKNHQEKEYQPQ
jgi:predicted amidohydrolase